SYRIPGAVRLLSRQINVLDHRPFAVQEAIRRCTRAGERGVLTQELDERFGDTAKRGCNVSVALQGPQSAERGATEMHRPIKKRVKHRPEIAGRGIDDLEHLGGRGLLVERLARFVDQPSVRYRDDRLVGESL